MAKRKGLTLPNPAALSDSPLETKSMFPTAPNDRGASAPIAGVAADAATVAALQDLSDTMTQARAMGRMVIDVALDDVVTDYIERDRMAVDDGEMQALRDSLRARGQQTPIELVALKDQPGKFGLISGWRRCHALKMLHTETGEDQFANVQALLRLPETAAAAYLAMVEENEIRADLSYFERARIAVHCANNGVFETDYAALTGLYTNASRSRRSKIGSFMPIVRSFGDVLQFPNAMSERLGLDLAQAMRTDPKAPAKIRRMLGAKTLRDAGAEVAVLKSVIAKLKESNKPVSESNSTQTALPGLSVSLRNNALTLKGPALTEDVQTALLDWLSKYLKP